MILTCPACATRYFVGEDAVPPEGRTVRCAGCAAEWKAHPEAAPSAPDPVQPPSPKGGPSKAAPLPSAYRAKAKAQRQTMSAVAAGAVWGGMAAALVALIGLAVLFRVDVVRLWPRTAGAYAAVKLPVNPVGLAPENVTGGPALENGRAVTVVTGLLRNVTAAPRVALPLRVALLDKGGQPLATQVVRPLGRLIAPGEARPFQATFIDAPVAATALGVDFAFDAPPIRATAAPAPAPAPARTTTRPLVKPRDTTAASLAPTRSPGPAPVEARALPADSPYALHTPHG